MGKEIKTEQTELLKVSRDYWRMRKELPPQKDLEELPLFNLEYQYTEQLSLFNEASGRRGVVPSPRRPSRLC